LTDKALVSIEKTDDGVKADIINNGNIDEFIFHHKNKTIRKSSDNLGYVVKIDYKEDTDNGSEFKKSSNNTKTFLSGVKDNPVEAYHCLVQHATDSKSYFL